MGERVLEFLIECSRQVGILLQEVGIPLLELGDQLLELGDEARGDDIEASRAESGEVARHGGRDM